MADKKYLDEDGLAVVATKVNEKLKVVSTMPTTPTNGQVVLYIGTTTADYTQGGIYLYNGTAWVLISTADVDLTPYKKIFTGTKAEWDALTTAEKTAYDEADLTDDLAGGELVVSDAVTSGDLNPVTSNAVANHLVLDTINLGEVTVAANTNYNIILSDYNIDTHNKPWIAFMYNRSSWSQFGLFGDGSNTLILRNTTASSVTGIAVIAILHYGA